MGLPTQEQVSYTKGLLASVSKQNMSSKTESIESTMNFQEHPEGGYFAETDRDPLKVPNPFRGTPIYPTATVKDSSNTNNIDETSSRNASTTIHYYLDHTRPNGVFHRNKARTVHTLHWGRGVYVLIHADEVENNSASDSSSPVRPKARIETFTVGPNIAAGERLQWIVEGGKFKASFLLPDEGTGGSEKGLLISETVVPGFEFMDHDFLTIEGMKALIGEGEFERLEWMVKKDEGEST